MKQNIARFIQTQKQKKLLTKVTLTMYLNQSIVLLYQIYKNHSEKIQIGLLIQSYIKILIFQSTTSKLVAVMSNYQKI